MSTMSKVCAVCARFTQALRDCALDSLPNAKQLLRPRIYHDAQQLVQGMLLCPQGLSSDDRLARICPACLLDLQRNFTPTLSMAGGLWLGNLPSELEGLSAVERYLILGTSPFELSIDVRCPEVNAGGMTETVYDLAFRSHVLLGPTLPLNVRLLRELVYLPAQDGPSQMCAYHKDFVVRRDRVRVALQWLVRNNGAYTCIVVCEANLELLPEDGLLWDFVARVVSRPRHSSSTCLAGPYGIMY